MSATFETNTDKTDQMLSRIVPKLSVDLSYSHLCSHDPTWGLLMHIPYVWFKQQTDLNLFDNFLNENLTHF